MNELKKHIYDGIGTDISEEYSGMQDGTTVIKCHTIRYSQQRKGRGGHKRDCIRCYIHYAAWTEIYRQAGYKTIVVPVTTEEHRISKAARPFNRRLYKSKLKEVGFNPLPTWWINI